MGYDFLKNSSSYSSFQKTSLDPSIYTHVDLALKGLKLVTRRLSIALIALEDESRLLDRLFYKGKNQHGASLFWRHVQEMRRLCSRFTGLDLSKSVVQIRHSFYNSADHQNQNVLKSSWTQLPDVKALRSIVCNIKPIRELLLKISESFMAAYSSFKRAMQAGAFLQLLLTLSAIVCRLHALAQVLIEVHEELAATLLHLCTSLEESTVLKRLNQQPSESDGVFASPTSPMTPTTGLSKDKHCRPDQKQVIRVRELVAYPKKCTGNTKASVDRSTKPARQPESTIDKKSSTLRMKKKKKFTDEIDAIFGF